MTKAIGSFKAIVYDFFSLYIETYDKLIYKFGQEINDSNAKQA